jgi:hypothetical protein
MTDIWVCSNCGLPVEPFFGEAGYLEGGGEGVRCPGLDPECTPREDRELLTPEQVKRVSAESLIQHAVYVVEQACMDSESEPISEVTYAGLDLALAEHIAAQAPNTGHVNIWIPGSPDPICLEKEPNG